MVGVSVPDHGSYGAKRKGRNKALTYIYCFHQIHRVL